MAARLQDRQVASLNMKRLGTPFLTVSKTRFEHAKFREDKCRPSTASHRPYFSWLTAFGCSFNPLTNPFSWRLDRECHCREGGRGSWEVILGLMHAPLAPQPKHWCFHGQCFIRAACAKSCPITFSYSPSPQFFV